MSPVLLGGFFTTNATWETHDEAIVTSKHKFLWLSCGASLVAPLWGFPYGSAGKESAHNAGNPDFIPGLGNPVEKRKATYSSILAWRIHGLYSPWGPKEMGRTKPLSLSFQTQINSMSLSMLEISKC